MKLMLERDLESPASGRIPRYGSARSANRKCNNTLRLRRNLGGMGCEFKKKEYEGVSSNGARGGATIPSALHDREQERRARGFTFVLGDEGVARV